MTEVLLVDDDGSVLITLAIALRRRGHRISVARDALDALEYLRLNEASVVVSDVRMPGMDGFELAHRVHQLPHPPRVILTSAYSNLPPLGEDVQAFVQKPIDIDLLNSLLTDPQASPPAGPQTQPKSAARKSIVGSKNRRLGVSRLTRPIGGMRRPPLPTTG